MSNPSVTSSLPSILKSGALGALWLACSLCVMATAHADPSSDLIKARALYDRGEWNQAVALYESVYSAQPATSPMKAEAALEWSSILWEQGDYRAGKARAEEALELAKAQKLNHMVGRLLLTIGHIEVGQGKLSTARNTFKICASMSGAQSDQVFSALCHMNLSLVQRLQGGKGMSVAQLKADIAKLESAKTPLTSGSALAKTADLFLKTKDYGQAMVLLERAQDYFVAAGSVPAQARNRLRIATVLQESGQYDRARAPQDGAGADEQDEEPAGAGEPARHARARCAGARGSPRGDRGV